MADEGVQEVFPNVEPIIAAYQLFTVHLMEEIDKDYRILTELRVSDRGLEATANPLAPGGLRSGGRAIPVDRRAAPPGGS